ncbi:cyclin-dependent kinase 9-like [Belonocnema kinseyi]|uniref:cyclin-dependent kinase 9-like n=1 Tax=Belonocnema kinseyi TaxID=2817044 RepID=UPI00143D7830|nr:cyclin-dependent kinase 9-like [Belonocnema kinseyi]
MNSTLSTNPMNPKEKEKYIEEFNFPYCDESTKYEKVAKIGQGTFGEVFKARDKKTGKKFVAMKKVLMDNEKEGFPITALREIKILQLLKHENIVNLIEICRTKATPGNRYRSTFYLIFDFCEHDLAGLLSNVNVKFSLGEIKQVMVQLLNGLYYIHSNKILHRDMKAANVLITKTGILKLADFGLARAFSMNKNGQANRYTNRVVTLWYRPPELLLGDRNYGPPVDLWGTGCIMAEMWTRSPIMQGNTEQQQLTLISQLCGSITPDVWPAVADLDLYNKMELIKGQKRKVKERLKPYVKDAYACDLLDKLLLLDPTKRYDADQAMDHEFFWVDPMPCDLSKMLSQYTQSMFEYLAPPRRSGHLRHPHHPVTGGPSKPSTSVADSGYQDRVF